MDRATDSPSSKVASISALVALATGGLSDSDLQTALANYRPTRLGVQQTFINMGGNQIFNVADPTLGGSAATKSYVDTAISNVPTGGSTDFANIASNVLPDVDNARDLGSTTRTWNNLHVNHITRPVTTVAAQQRQVPELGVRDVHEIDFSGNDHQEIVFDNDPFLIRGRNYTPGSVIDLLILNGGSSSNGVLTNDNTGGLNSTGWNFSTRGINGAQANQYTITSGECIILRLWCRGTTAGSVCVARMP